MILKQYVETHWCSQSDKFRPPETTERVMPVFKNFIIQSPSAEEERKLYFLFMQFKGHLKSESNVSLGRLFPGI